MEGGDCGGVITVEPGVLVETMLEVKEEEEEVKEEPPDLLEEEAPSGPALEPTPLFTC